jgi:hypothetical protein
MGQDTTECDGGANQSVEFLVTADGELQMTRSDALDFEILGRVAGKFEHFGGQVFEHSSQIDGCLGADAGFLSGNVAEMALDTTAGKL